MSGHIDALAVLDAVEAVITARVHRYNGRVNRAEVAGRVPHDEDFIKRERAAYLADNYTLARKAVAELVNANKGLLPRNLCLTNPNVPESTEVPLLATVGELRALQAAIAKFGEQS